MGSRLELDARYVEFQSPMLDLKIVARTIVNVLKRSGVVKDPASAMQDLDVERRHVHAPGAAQ